MPGWQIEAYERLRIQIVKSAVTDLKRAIRKSVRLGEVCDEQKKLEGWFLTKWGQMLSGDNGELIIEKCHNEHKDKFARKARWKTSEETQKSILDDYQNGVSRREILKKYGITIPQYEKVLRTWRSETL